jgi:hypothetical protein
MAKELSDAAVGLALAATTAHAALRRRRTVWPIFDSWVFRAHAKLLNSLVVASVLAKLVVPRLDAVRH